MLTGDIDSVTCAEVADLLVSAIDRTDDDTLFVDVSAVTFIDSSGLSALVSARNHAAALEKRITLVGVRSRVQTVLNITGLSQIFLG